MDRIRIEALEVDCIVGVRSFERRRRQTVGVDIELGVDLSKAGRSGRITETIDYAQVADEVSDLLRFREYRLIEVATEELAAMLFGVHPLLAEVRIRLEKPEALRGRARSASVEIARRRTQFPAQIEVTEYGSLETLFVTPEARLLLYRILPGEALVVTEPHALRRMERALSEELALSVDAPARSAVARQARVARYHNQGAEPAALFCCESSQS